MTAPPWACWRKAAPRRSGSRARPCSGAAHSSWPAWRGATSTTRRNRAWGRRACCQGCGQEGPKGQGGPGSKSTHGHDRGWAWQAWRAWWARWSRRARLWNELQGGCPELEERRVVEGTATATLLRGEKAKAAALQAQLAAIQVQMAAPQQQPRAAQKSPPPRSPSLYTLAYPSPPPRIPPLGSRPLAVSCLPRSRICRARAGAICQVPVVFNRRRYSQLVIT